MRKLKDIIETLYKTDNLLFPCKDWKIRNIEQELNVKLPVLYKEFLLAMGKSAGDFMLGSSCFYNDLIDISMDAIELLEENNYKPLPNNSFVFWMHQGYQFAFFSLDSGEDPPRLLLQ